MVAFAALALLLQPRLRALAGERDMPRAYSVSLFVVAIYGGYFGAGAGVIFLAIALILTSEKIWRATILKSFLLGVANLVAAIGFAIFGPVHWGAAAAMAIGALAGGWCGPPSSGGYHRPSSASSSRSRDSGWPRGCGCAETTLSAHLSSDPGSTVTRWRGAHRRRSSPARPR